MGQGLIGSNTTRTIDYTAACYLNNAAQQCRQFWITGTNNTGVPVDANGWPTTAFDVLITSQIGVYDGQLPHGTYQCSYRSVGQSTTVAALANCTLSNVVQDPDGVTTHFQMVTVANANIELRFSGAVQYIGIPRDGVTPTYGGPEFYAPAIAATANKAGFRTMDMANINYRTTETDWSQRPVDRGVTGPSFYSSNIPYSWERIIRFINAVGAYPGSQLTHVHFNVPGTATAAYMTSLSTLVTSMLTANVTFEIGYGNEQWNFGAPQPTYFGQNLIAAQNEAQTVAGFIVGGNSNYGGTASGSLLVNNIASISRTSDVVTVQTTTPLQSWIVNGATPAISNGSDSTWNASIVGGAGNQANPVTGFTVIDSTHFSYTQPQTGTPNVTLTSTTGANLAFYFNTASTLVSDGTSYNLNNFNIKVYVRNLLAAQQAWAAVRPQDKWCLEWQQFGNGGWGAFFANQVSDPYFVQYANWLAVQQFGAGSTLLSFVDSIAIAPYTRLTPQYQSIASGASQVLGVPYASQYVVGDSIIVKGAGVANADLTTTVAAGSTGTTLNITGTASSTVANYVYGSTPARLFPVSGASPATLVAMWMGYADSFNTQAILAAAYIATKYGLRLIAYEGGQEQPQDDVTITDAQIIALMATAGVGTNIAHILDVWFSAGGDDFYLFSDVPGFSDDPYSFQLQGVWTDTTSPKEAARIAYTANRQYSNLNSDGAGGATCYAKNAISTNAALSTANATLAAGPSGGVLNWPVNTVTRWSDWPIQIPRAGEYQIIATMCDSSTGTLAHVTLDTFATDIGTLNVVGTGAGDSATSSPADSTTTLIATFTTRGKHNIRIYFPPTSGGTGIRPGVAEVRVIPVGS